jgi:hypothetical protein
MSDQEKAAANKEPTTGVRAESESDKAAGADGADNDFKITISGGGPVQVEEKSAAAKASSRARNLAREVLTSLIMLPFQVLLVSLSSIIVALLYLKTRQAGGESLQDLLTQFEETDRPQTKWQERVRQRLIQSGRITSKT